MAEDAEEIPGRPVFSVGAREELRTRDGSLSSERENAAERRRVERRGTAWQSPSSGQAESASAQAASAFSSYTTVRTSWYDETAGRK
jgi:hypothetical protein